MTINGTWGYKSYDNNWKSTEVLLHNLIDIASKGGNYLLNVGPTPEGEIPKPCVERLLEIGHWLKVNGESIYGTTASPFFPMPTWGRCTKKISDERTILYLHIFKWPSAPYELRVDGLTRHYRLLSASILEQQGPRPIDARQNELTTILKLPAQPPHRLASVVKLTVAGPVRLIITPIPPAGDGSILLTAAQAIIHGKKLKYEYNKKKKLDCLGFWVDKTDWAEWTIVTDKKGEYKLRVVVATPAEKTSLIVKLADSQITGAIQRTGSYAKFREQELGRIRVDHEGMLKLSVHCGTHWSPLNLKAIKLIPIP